MPRLVELKILPSQIDDTERIRHLCASRLSIGVKDIDRIELVRKSIDGRGRQVYFVLRVAVFLQGESVADKGFRPLYQEAQTDKTLLIIGAGPAGYFAALRCLELGLKPIVLERGKNVRERRRDLRQIQQYSIVNPDSNYCFGEGGAGTYSDGKLYTRSNKRGSVNKILQTLVYHGAKEDILIDAHPHIGSNKLPGIVSNLRETIEKYGGEVHFNHKVNDFLIEKGRFLGVRVENGAEFRARATILATGHSARDIYRLSNEHKIAMSFKPFAIGARIEHPQELIDEIQYGNRIREEKLPAASYSLSCQVGNKGVFSFCMCPGGLIVPAATSPGELVVNGMSLSRRDSPFANAATVVTLDQNPDPANTLGGMFYQEHLEKAVFDVGDGTQKAPAQRLTDFLAKVKSADLGNTSYIPGIYSAPMHEILPHWISHNISSALREFERKMRGYISREAMIIGLESRTSAPVRLDRDAQSFMSTNTANLFPCAEGAGYAGGILSAAMDGDNIAAAAAARYE